MPLPHPHGNASGEIGHNSVFDTGQTPGSTGGKFIGFGEEGTSAIANRAHWALSENIDHIYDAVSADLAVPAGYSRTSPVGGESSYQFPVGEEIWVGDASYPGSAGASDPEGMEMLFSVLDDQYNELTDGSGNEIRVKMVRESTGVTDVYQGGSPFLDSFQSQPIIYFMAVDSSGTPVTDPYTIPAGVDYKIQCGIKSNLESLPTDALIRFKVQAANEIQAGVFLQDGTKKMTGDADWDGHKLLNLDEARGASGADLLIRSLQDLNLQGDQELTLKDQYLSTAIPLSESGVSAMYKPASAAYSSVVGALGSQNRVAEIVRFNRCVDRTGSFTPSAGTTVDYPALKLVLGGEYVEIPAGTATAYTGSGTYHMYVNPSGTVGLFEYGVPPGLPAGSVVIWRGTFDGATVWSDTHDLRWPSDRKGNIVEVYVGDMMGVDFASIDDCVEWTRYAGYVTDTIKPKIIVCGTATASGQILLGGGWTLEGLATQGSADGAFDSVIQTTTTFPTTSHLISTSWGCTVRNLELIWMNSSSDQNVANYAISGSYNCTFENLKIRGSSYEFGNGIYTGSISGYLGSVVRNCYFDGWGAGTAIYPSARTIIENCSFNSRSVSATCINALGTGYWQDDTHPAIKIRDCVFGGSAPTVAIIEVSGPSTVIENCYGDLSGAVANTCGFVRLSSAHVLQERGGCVIRNCHVENGWRFTSANTTNTNLRMHVVCENNFIRNFGSTVFDFNFGGLHEGSSMHVINNTITECTSRIGYWDDAYYVYFAGNKVSDHNSYGIEVRANTQATIDGNWFEGWGADRILSLPSGLATGTKFTNNYVGAPTHSGAICMLIDSENVLIQGNDIRGDNSNAATCINVRSGNVRIIGNTFTGYTDHYIRIDDVYGGADYGSVAHNTFDAGLSGTDSSAVMLTNTPIGWSISHNQFYDIPKIAIELNSTHDCAVIGNSIVNCTCGAHSVANAAIYASSGSRSVIIQGNTLQNIGNTSPASTFLSHVGIYCAAPYSVISGNTVREMVGSNQGQTGGTLYDGATGIEVIGDNCACNNNFFRHTFGSNDPHAYVYGIRSLSQFGTMVGNCAWLTGTATNPGGMFSGSVHIDGGSYHMCIVGNAAYGSCNTNSIGGDTAFLMQFTEGAIVGNIAEVEDVNWGDASSSISIGNVHANTGATMGLGAYPTSTAYNVNTANPLTDLNRKLAHT